MGFAADAPDMTLHRFFVAPDALRGDRFALPDQIAHQVRRVLRLQDGDRMVLLDGTGEAVTVRLSEGACVVESRGPAGGEPVHRLTIWQALLRGDHLEPVVRHGTEIGVAEFRLFVSERCVARDVSAGRLDRLRTVAREAAEQSERGIVPPVVAPVPFRDVLEPTLVLLYERSDSGRLGSMTPAQGLIIGPEGGFSPAELAAAERAGVTLAGLGPRILRSETVALAAAAVVLSRSGDFA
jgi:16S rRNA (uracil1498-N3)-methyltransferase